MLGGYATPGT
ncbi:hypothetical protein L0F41_18015 [Klebsiella pneumoniae]|nr:hypothetical protein [Klebsiella pneumoniae]